jgi:hypothetical protein
MLAVFGGLLGGRLLYIQIQSAFDKRWCENHSIEFNIIKHDEIEEYRVDRSVRRIQESLESFRNQYPINTSGTPLKELHLYANHDSFIAQTGSDNNTAAFFSLRSGVPGIYMPANLYFMQPEAILHEAMHSYVYEIFGESYGEIPLWLHDGYAQYLSMNWSDLIDKRVRTKLFLWKNKPKDLQAPAFLLYCSQYPSDTKTKDLFYKSSFAFVDFLESRTNDNLFTQILYDTSRGKPCNTTIKESMGIDLDSLYFNWVKLNTGLE